MQLDYTIRPGDAGEFHFYAISTYQPQLARSTLPGLPFADSAGYGDGPLKWRGNAGLTWERGPWSAGWNMQYYDSYYIYPSTAGTAERSEDVLNQGAARIPSQSYHDLFAMYRFQPKSSTMLKGLQLSLGINNVLNQVPPIIASAGSTGAFAYSNYGDPRLRRFSLSLHKKF
jgi:outer membrane receptor protein involved in Fe transport